MIVGHQKEKEIFKTIIEGEKLHHAYIFSGRDGSGKKMFARELARSIICAEQSYMTPCQCRHCTVISGSEHPDIHLIEDSPVKIEVARQISNDAFMSPLSAKKKVYIIDNAHTFTKEAANAILKTLEEPPGDTHFFLITDRYEQVLPTIRSRCINIRFSNLTNDEVEQVLMQSGVMDGADAAEQSSGSVSYAMFLLESLETSGTFSPDKNRKELFAEINGLDTKEKVRAYTASLYSYILDRYKETDADILIEFSNYLLDILKRLEYNVSLDMFRMDLYIKTTEVLCEKN